MARLRNTGNTAPSNVPSPRGSILPLGLGRALIALCCLVVLYGTYNAIPRLSAPLAMEAWGAAAVFLVTFTAAIEIPQAVFLLPVSALAAVAMQYCAPNNGALVAVIALLAVIAIRLDPSTSRRLSVAMSAAFVGASLLAAHPLTRTQVVSILPALLFTYLAATATRRLRVEQQRTAQLLEEVVAGRDAVIRAAALDERAHLAREMHDVLAHTLSALSIQLEGARMLAEESSCDPAIAAALERSSRLAKEGLGEARRAVGSLRGEELPGPDLLPGLAEEFERDTGVPCGVRTMGDPIELPADARLALYRVTQEALTNVRKHADASRVEISLRYISDGIELAVENWGSPLAVSLPGGGYGVSGMRERAELLGGHLDASPTGEGYRVALWIPARSLASGS